jgi:hypothetical protein
LWCGWNAGIEKRIKFNIRCLCHHHRHHCHHRWLCTQGTQHVYYCETSLWAHLQRQRERTRLNSCLLLISLAVRHENGDKCRMNHEPGMLVTNKWDGDVTRCARSVWKRKVRFGSLTEMVSCSHIRTRDVCSNRHGAVSLSREG